ncbi:hypothetical protein STEG23_006092, partial [Scotinomys teguina]
MQMDLWAEDGKATGLEEDSEYPDKTLLPSPSVTKHFALCLQKSGSQDLSLRCESPSKGHDWPGMMAHAYDPNTGEGFDALASPRAEGFASKRKPDLQCDVLDIGPLWRVAIVDGIGAEMR